MQQNTLIGNKTITEFPNSPDCTWPHDYLDVYKMMLGCTNQLSFSHILLCIFSVKPDELNVHFSVPAKFGLYNCNGSKHHDLVFS